MSLLNLTRSATRRTFVRMMGAVAAGSVLRAQSPAKGERISGEIELLLDEMQRRASRYFFEQAHPETGLVLDRARAEGPDPRTVASIAATGFGLSALVIGSTRGFIPTSAASARAERTLEFFARRADHERGFFYHFQDAGTGERAYQSEASSVDTAWLLCGALHARQHFDTPRIRLYTSEILDRTDWRWMANGSLTLCHGWTPEAGFLPYRWDRYCELLAMYMLAMSAKEHGLGLDSWHAWARPVIVSPQGKFVSAAAPLFVHQYSHAWLDFRGRLDGDLDYFENSRMATLAHRDFCLSLRDRFPWFSDDMWGITASDSRYGYIDWGGNPVADLRIDGTLVPCASGGSLVFLPDECSRVLLSMVGRYGKRVWTRYGFVDAFQPTAPWWASPDVIGIDLGIMLLMAENYRTGSVWNAMMTAPEIRRAFAAARFVHA